MSILVVQVLPQGIIFGADRNVTLSKTLEEANGMTSTIYYGQTPRTKVLKWPNKKALVGYVGAAEIGTKFADEWLYSYIGNNINFSSFDDLARDLREEVETQRRIDEGDKPAEPLLIHLGGFEERDGQVVPVVWFIRNAHGMNDRGYTDIRKEFLNSEEFWKYFPSVLPANIGEKLAERARAYSPFWFHQGFDLGTFNALETYLRGAFKLLIENHPVHQFPETLEEWQKHLEMSILTYEAYFKSFKGPGEQFVGGGVDSVALEWP